MIYHSGFNNMTHSTEGVIYCVEKPWNSSKLSSLYSSTWINVCTDKMFVFELCLYIFQACDHGDVNYVVDQG